VPTGDGGACAEVQKIVAQALFGPQDYAVLGYKLSDETPVRPQR
jgi:hypothetical protein